MDKFEYQKKIPEFLPGSSKNFYSVILYGTDTHIYTGKS